MKAKDGHRKDRLAYRLQYANEIGLLAKGLTIRNISALCQRSPNTILKIKRMFL